MGAEVPQGKSLEVGDGGSAAAATRVARNSLWILAARLMESGASVLIAGLLARYLGVRGYGRYAVIVSFVMLFGQFITFGLEHIVIREAARKPRGLKELLAAAMTLEFAAGAVVLPAMLIASAFAGLEAGDWLAVAAFGAAFFLRAFYEVVFRATFISQGKARYETLFALLYQALRVVFVAGVVIAGWGFYAVFGAVLLAEVINGAVAYRFLRSKFVAVKPAAAFPITKYLLSQAWPIAVVGILNNVYLQQDIMLIKWLSGDYEGVGYFAAAYRVVTFFIFIAVPMLWPLLPSFSRLVEEGAGRVVEGVRRASVVTAFFALPAAVGLAWFAPEVITIIYGRAYLPATLALRLLAVSALARPMWYVADAALIAAGRQRVLAVAAALAVAINFAGDFILIPRVGFLGAAWGTAIADVAGLMAAYGLASVVFRRLVFPAALGRPVVVAVTTVAALAAVSGLPRWVSGGVYVAVAVAGTTLLLGARDRRALTDIFSAKAGSGVSI